MSAALVPEQVIPAKAFDGESGVAAVVTKKPPPNTTELQAHLVKACGLECKFEFLRDRTHIRIPFGGGVVPGGQTKTWMQYHEDEHAMSLMRVALARYGREPTKGIITDIVRYMARQNYSDPVLDYLESVHGTWDGTHRVQDFFGAYIDVRPSVAGFSAAELRKFSIVFVTMLVARRYWPGLAWPFMIVLQGHQGVGKSGPIEVLAGARGYASVKKSLSGKEVETNIHKSSPLVCEVAEVDGMTEGARNALKTAVSERHISFRPLYANETYEYGKRWVYIGTTNDEHFLPPGEEAHRRFIPLAVGAGLDEGYDKVDTAEAKRRVARTAQDRDQLFAEAILYWELACANAGEQPRDNEGRSLCVEAAASPQALYDQFDISVEPKKMRTLSQRVMLEAPGQPLAEAITGLGIKLLVVDSVKVALMADRRLPDDGRWSTTTLPQALRKAGYVSGRITTGRYWAHPDYTFSPDPEVSKAAEVSVGRKDTERRVRGMFLQDVGISIVNAWSECDGDVIPIGASSSKAL